MSTQAELILEEALRSRALQDGRRSAYERISLATFPIAALATALLVDPAVDQTPFFALGVAALTGMVVAVVEVHRPVTWHERLEVADLIDGYTPYPAAPAHDDPAATERLRRHLARLHEANRADNEVALRRKARALKWEYGAAVVLVLSLVVNAGVVS